jgi:hypothetical protein
MRTHVFDSPKARRVAAGVAAPIISIGYVELAGKAGPVVLDRYGYSHQHTAGTATAAALHISEGGYQPAPPSGPVEPSGSERFTIIINGI